MINVNVSYVHDVHQHMYWYFDYLTHVNCFLLCSTSLWYHTCTFHIGTYDEIVKTWVFFPLNTCIDKIVLKGKTRCHLRIWSLLIIHITFRTNKRHFKISYCRLMLKIIPLHNIDYIWSSSFLAKGSCLHYRHCLLRLWTLTAYFSKQFITPFMPRNL